MLHAGRPEGAPCQSDLEHPSAAHSTEAGRPAALTPGEQVDYEQGGMARLTARGGSLSLDPSHVPPEGAGKLGSVEGGYVPQGY